MVNIRGKTTSTDFLPLNLNNETYFYRDWVPAKTEKSGFSSRFFAELNMLNKKRLLKKDYIYDIIVNINVTQ